MAQKVDSPKVTIKRPKFLPAKITGYTVYVFMSTSMAHVLYLVMQNNIHREKQKRQLQRLSETHWACRYLSLDVITNTYDTVLATLESISDRDDKSKAIKAAGQTNKF